MRWMVMATLSVGFLGLTACDDGDGDSSAPAANCQDRCQNKLSECGQDPSASAGFCQDFCGDMPTEGEVSCAEGKSCDDLLTGGADACFQSRADGGGSCPELDCACGISGMATINGRCAMNCEEACAALGGGMVPDDLPGFP